MTTITRRHHLTDGRVVDDARENCQEKFAKNFATPPRVSRRADTFDVADRIARRPDRSRRHADPAVAP
jgi:hypothetical protein